MFTHREKTVKCTTVANAITSARNVLKESEITDWCANAVSGRDPKESITIEEASKLTERIVNDSRFHSRRR